MLIELHEMFAPGVTDRLRERFAKTHMSSVIPQASILAHPDDANWFIRSFWQDLNREDRGGWLSSRTDRLHIAVAWENGELTAVLPLTILRWHGIRILQWAAQSVSDYCDALGDSEATLRQLWTMASKRGRFDIVRLKNVRLDAAIRPILREAVGPGEASDTCLQVLSQWPNGEK
jgi:hypothetical protein